MYRLLFKTFVRTKIFALSLVLLVSVGFVSILIGKQYLVKQENAIVAAEMYQEESITRNLKYHNDDLGLLLYYLRFTLIKKPNNINAISIGQSDVNPLLQAVTIRGLEGQKYDTDFENPSLLMSGNLDLSFVIIYLFPLVIIAMTFNLYSEEKELGTWRILAAQTSGRLKFLLNKLGIRIAFVLCVLILLFALASSILNIEMDQNFVGLFLQSVLYILFWNALCLFIVSYQKNSNVNALSLISVWVVLTVLVPAMVNNYVLNKYQIPEALNAMVEQRDGYHEKWDLEKDATMIGFFEAYPQFKKYSVPDDKFSWIWYYGMQHMGDITARQSSMEMHSKILLRNTFSENVALFVPTMHAQLSFNDLAGTDMVSHLNYLQALTKYHEELRLKFYPKIFEKEPATIIDWNTYHAKFYHPKRGFNWIHLLIPTLLSTLAIGVLGAINLKKL